MEKLVFTVNRSDFYLAELELDRDVKDLASSGTPEYSRFLRRTCPVWGAVMNLGLDRVWVGEQLIHVGEDCYRMTLSAQSLVAAWDYHVTTGERRPDWRDYAGKVFVAIKQV